MEAAKAVFIALTYVLGKYDRDFVRTFVAAFEEGLEVYVDNNPVLIPQMTFKRSTYGLNLQSNSWV